MSVTTDIAEAVAGELNAAAFQAVALGLGVEVAAQVHARPTFARADMEALHVSVVPKARGRTRDTRGESHYEIQVDVGIQQALGQDADETAEKLIALGEAVEKHMAGRALAMPRAICRTAETDPIYSVDDWDTRQQFTSVTTLTFRVAD
jgi:hypothetical protein